MGRILCVGHAVEDHVFRVGQIPTTPTKHQATGYSVVGGGPAANAAVAIARLGGDAMLAARVGNDNVGGSIIHDLQEEGVDCSLVQKFENGQSSLSAVLVDDDGQRMIVNYLDETLPSQADWLQASFSKTAGPSGVGYSGVGPKDVDAVLADVRWPEGAKLAFSVARDNNIPAILDADHPIPDDEAVLRKATHLAFSAEGLSSYTGMDDFASAILHVWEKFQVWACVTDGERGVYIADQNSLTHVPAYNVTSVDTTGAGDVWHGAFALRLAQGETPYEAVLFANAVAAIKVTRAGGRKGAPYLSEVEDFVHKQSQELRA